MSNAMYDHSIPVFAKMLGNLSTILDKGAKHCEAAKIDPGARKVHKFKSGMLAHVMLRLGEKQDALLAPKDALVLGGSSINGQPAYQVFVAKTADGGKTYTAQPVQVAIGMYDNGWVEITGRLSPLLGDAAFPNGLLAVCPVAVAGEGLEPPTSGL